ncbi:hypothetical protein [Aequorivita antarctica]|uniref:DUF4013 domain-containing protein n=1 Tax=Aequorivita antarctica TaxID=153266 RepID=A0A5C6YX71_9FLAO|nr:hypothetical protein [Aequorivita antarctica]TXD71793.1 hypothetical protein ESU54_15335 [Aequorivita antarctica]SRX75507.1 hypothetical protein AEQU3_02503 [Aequorivita antarctica]
MEPHIFQKIETAKSPDFGGILSKSFELFKKVWVEGMLHLLVTLAIILPFLAMLYIPFIAILIKAEANGGRPDFNPFLEYSVAWIAIYIVAFLVVMIIIQTIAYAITAHFFKVLKKADTGIPLETGGYFDYLKNHFQKILVLSLAAFGITLLAAILCYLPIFYVMVPLQIMFVIFAFNPQLSVSEIVKTGFKLGNRFWLIAFGLIIVSSLIAQAGIILCGIGLLATAFFTHIPMYYFYKETIGFDEELQEDLPAGSF